MNSVVFTDRPMTKEQVIEVFGRSVYELWMEVALKHFDCTNPDAGFVDADLFIETLLAQELPAWK